MPLYSKKPKRCKHAWIERDCHTPAHFHNSTDRCTRCGITRKWFHFGHSAGYRDLWHNSGDVPHYCECRYNVEIYGSPCCTGRIAFPTDDREEKFQ